MKNIVLIRHGESLGQTARQRGVSRKDPSLLDCFLSPKGIRQAQFLGQSYETKNNEFDLICVSPLTRALATSLLVFRYLFHRKEEKEDEMVNNGNEIMPTTGIPFLCHPGLAEVGGAIPENQGRPLEIVMSDIQRKLQCIDPRVANDITNVDFSLLQPQNDDGGRPWPRSTRFDFMRWLNDRPEQNIAIVCHHNIIQHSLCLNDSVSNCSPISCVMHEGHLDTFYLPGTTPIKYSSGTETLSTNNDGRKKKGSHHGKKGNCAKHH